MRGYSQDATDRDQARLCLAGNLPLTIHSHNPLITIFMSKIKCPERHTIRQYHI
jgi:hypothetical protein